MIEYQRGIAELGKRILAGNPNLNGVEQTTITAQIAAAEASAAYLESLKLPNPSVSTEPVVNQPLLDLDKEWATQVDKLAYLFAKPLKQSRDEYMDGLPKFAPQPEAYKDRLDIPVLVQTPTAKLTLSRIVEIAKVDGEGIVNYLDLDKVQDWQKDPGKFRTPKTPYATWLNDGSVNLNRTVESVRVGLTADERGATIFDGIALAIQKPDILKGHYLDLPGSQYGSGSAPRLRFWGSRVELLDYFVDYAFPGFGSVVAGRNIVTR